MTIKPGDPLNTEVTMTAPDGSVMVAEGVLTVTSSTIPIPPDPIPPDPGPNPDAGMWITPASMIISSLEMGHLGYVYAWGGSAFAYGYAYTIEGAPTGLVIDQDTGRLSLTAATLAVRDYPMTVVVKNRDDLTRVNKFNFTLSVKQGVTTVRSGDQILHKTYDLAAGTWGNPSGTDWTAPIRAMRTQIINDQTAAGDSLLRADILFRKGMDFQYTWNRWVTGIQYFRAIASGSGAPPVMKCIRNDPNDPYNSGPLGTESSNAMRYQGNIKQYCALIQSTAVGDDTITLKNSSETSRLKVGRYHAVMSGCQQLGGYPPNVRHIDYVKVVSMEVSGGIVKLDRKLKYAHKSNYWEDSTDWASFGKAYIVPWDMHPAGSVDPLTPRMIQRGQFIGLNFVPGSSDISLAESFADMYFEGCSIPNPQFTMSQFVTAKDCSLHGGEPDKMVEQAVFDNCTNDGEMGGATGCQYFLIRGGTYKPMQVSPRQFRVMNATIDATGNTHLNVPFSMAYNGPLWEYEFDNVNFIADSPNQKTWTWNNPPVSPLTLGGNSWVADDAGHMNRLVIPRSFGPFQDWLVWAYEPIHPDDALILMKGTVQAPGDYGVIEKVSAPDNGSALWLDIKWIKGTKPASGTVVIPQHGPRKLIWKNNTRISKGSWIDPAYLCQVGTPADRPFPLS